MRKLLLLLLLLLLLSNFLISCSTDKLPTEEQVSEFPTDISLDKQEVKIYDTLTISGNGFSLNKEYVILFESNIIANIIETTDNYIKVEVPENAQSGKISLKYNELSKIIGEVSIISEKAYARSNGKIVEINLEDGTTKEISEYFENYDIIFAPLESKNILVGIDNKLLESQDWVCSLIKINLDNGKVESIILNDLGYEYSSIVIVNEKIIAYRGNGFRWESRLVEINLEDGTETDYSDVFQASGRFDYRGNQLSLKLNTISKEIIGKPTGSNGGNPYRLFKCNINSKELSYIELNHLYYSGGVVDKKTGNYYLLRKEGTLDVYDTNNNIIKRNIQSKFDRGYFIAEFNVSTNEIIQINNSTNELVKFNTETETTKIIPLANTYGPIVLK
jgi:hypothetical protein